MTKAKQKQQKGVYCNKSQTSIDLKEMEGKRKKEITG